MDFAATQHAAEVIAERGIRRQWIVTALHDPRVRCPDAADPELEHCLAIIEENGSRVLRVIFKRNTSPPLVITAFFDRKMKGKL
jgi:hypothetical protein